MNECRDAIAALQAERDDISAKIYDPDQVREILEELTNQLDSLADKMKSADSWQKDQLVRKLVMNLEISNKNEVSFRWKKPLENVFNQALKNRTRIGAPEATIFEQQIGAVIIDWFYENAGFSFNDIATAVTPEIVQNYIY